MFNPRRFFVLEIGDALLKAALIEKGKEGLRLKDMSTFSRDKSEIEKGLKKFQRYNKTKVILLIPPQKAFLRYMELPAGARPELKEMISFQLPRYLPYNAGDIIFDFRIVQEKKEGYVKVMVVCIQKQLLNEILEIIPRLEDNLYGIFLSGETVIESLANLIQEKEEVRTLIDISSEEVIFSIFDRGGLFFTRSLNPDYFKSKANWLKGVEELEKTVVAFKREFNERKITSTVVSGAKSYAADFYNFFKEHSREAVELFSPFDNWPCPLNIRLDALDRFSFQAVMGAALNIEKRPINLIPSEFLARKEFRLKRRSRLHVLCLLIIIICQSALVIHKQMEKKKDYLNCLAAEIKEIAPRAKAIEEKEKKMALIKEQLDMDGSALGVLKEVYGLIPAQISINILILEKDKSLSIRGTAASMAEVFKLISLLEKSPSFGKVISEGARMRKIKGAVVADFQLRALINDKKKGT